MARTKQKRAAKLAAATGAQAPAAAPVITEKENVPAQSTDETTLPSLYAAKVNPEGGIMLAEGETTTRAKKRRKSKQNGGIAIEPNSSEDEVEDASFAAHMPTDIGTTIQDSTDMKRAVKKKTKQSTAWERDVLPWTLLPENVKADVERRAAGEQGAQFWENSVVKIAVSNNCHIQATVKKLKAFLRTPTADLPSLLPKKTDAEGSESDPAPTPIFANNVLIPVIAQGKGISKLITVVEIAKRVSALDPEVQAAGKVEHWYTYTVLSSRVVEKRKRKFDDVRGYISDFEEGAPRMTPAQKTRKFQRAYQRMVEAQAAKDEKKPDGDDVEMGEAEVEAQKQAQIDAEDAQSEAAFEASELDAAKKGDNNDSEPKTRAVPVMTVWFSRQPIPEFRDAFKEEKVEVITFPGGMPKEQKPDEGRAKVKPRKRKSLNGTTDTDLQNGNAAAIAAVNAAAAKAFAKTADTEMDVDEEL